MDNQDSTLTFREFPLSNWILGILFLGLAATNLYGQGLSVGSTDFIFMVIEIAAGAFLILSGWIIIIHADRLTQTLSVRTLAVFNSSYKEVLFSDIEAIQLELNPASNRSQRSGLTYRIAIIRKSGEHVPASFFFNNGNKGKERMVEKLRAFVNVKGDDTGMGNIFQVASQLAAQQFQKEQETITGSEVEEHETDGVHWTLETRAFGGMPVSRWHSPDFKCDGFFLYLVQKMPGEKPSGGLIAKTLYKTSMALFGFSGNLTPNENRAELLAQLDPQLENDFSAYTSDASQARQVLSPWTVNPLAAWVQAHPLEKSNRGDELAILFSPEGLYLATMGLTNSEFLDEVTKLGAEMVKAQTGH
jgi:hypothetical protein